METVGARGLRVQRRRAKRPLSQARGAKHQIPPDVQFPSPQAREIGRGERIRTSDLCVPNAALYQAEPRPDRAYAGTETSRRRQASGEP